MEENPLKSPLSSDIGLSVKITFAERIREWCDLIKVEHTVFALPFALGGLILAGSGSESGLPSWRSFFFAILAFAGARSAAMSLNRVIDASMDAQNPRTRERSIPKGTIKRPAAIAFAVFSFVIMIAAAWQLPRLCAQLCPIAVIWLSFYSYTKRFTWLCHFCLGIALGGAALGGWIAGGGHLSTPAPWIFAMAVSTWVAGFDIIYACQDYDFDRTAKIFSIPARFGISAALIISSTLHLMTAFALAALGLVLNLGLAYWIGVLSVYIMLVYEHRIVSAKDLSRVNAAFFNINGMVSILCFICILIDKLTRS